MIVLALLLALVWTCRWLLAEHGIALEASVLLFYILKALTKPVYHYCTQQVSTQGRLYGLSVLFAFGAWHLYRQLLRIAGPTRVFSIDDGRRPLMCPAKTSHVRLFPKKHGFTYSYFLVAIPVGWQGEVGSLISVDTEATSKHDSASTVKKSWTWLSINADDYLTRGSAKLGLEDKLADYLRGQGEDISSYTHSWLVTAPRFLNYSFNPVSFWYLYNGSDLSAMILEVNNTFGERRMYFLRPSPPSPTSTTDAAAAPQRFTQTWPKDFHVSPFNSRKGSYSLSALPPNFPLPKTLDPQSLKSKPTNDTATLISNTITLLSSHAHAKITARIFSTSPCLPTSTLPLTSRLTVLVQYPWTGLITFPRIIREAFSLFFTRKLHVWFRPEVTPTSIPRKATALEDNLAGVLDSYLESAVRSSETTSPLVYVPAAGNGAGKEKVMHTTSSSHLDKCPDAPKLTVRGPGFYSDVVKTGTIGKYITQEARKEDKESLISIRNEKELVTYFQEEGLASPRQPASLERFPVSFAWKSLALVRGLSEGTASSIDDYARAHLDPPAADSYRGAAMKVMLGSFLPGGVGSDGISIIFSIVRILLSVYTFGPLFRILTAGLTRT